MVTQRRFVDLPLDKHQWSPSPLPGQVVLVTSVDADGEVDVAPKSWVSMVAFSGPVIGFGCSLAHRTYQNVRTTGEFVVNVPDASLAARVWRLPGSHGAERLARAGFSLQPSRTVAPPAVADCPAHLECRHLQTLTFPEDEVFVLGTVTAVDVDERCLAPDDVPGRYGSLHPFFFLEDGWHAALDTARPAGS